MNADDGGWEASPDLKNSNPRTDDPKIKTPALGSEWKSRTEGGLGAKIADRLDGTSFHGFLAGSLFFGGFRLLFYVGISAVIPASVIGRGGFTAEVAVNTLVVDEVLSRYVLVVTIRKIRHS